MILRRHSCLATGSVERSNQSVEATLATLRRLQREDGGNGVGFVQHLGRIMLTNNNLPGRQLSGGGVSRTSYLQTFGCNRPSLFSSGPMSHGFAQAIRTGWNSALPHLLTTSRRSSQVRILRRPLRGWPRRQRCLPMRARRPRARLMRSSLKRPWPSHQPLRRLLLLARPRTARMMWTRLARRRRALRTHIRRFHHRLRQAKRQPPPLTLASSGGSRASARPNRLTMGAAAHRKAAKKKYNDNLPACTTTSGRAR